MFDGIPKNPGKHSTFIPAPRGTSSQPDRQTVRDGQRSKPEGDGSWNPTPSFRTDERNPTRRRTLKKDPKPAETDLTGLAEPRNSRKNFEAPGAADVESLS